jgi:hypothetical protein
MGWAVEAGTGGDVWPSLGPRGAEGRILRYIRLCAARRPAPLLDPVFTVERLAGLLELGFDDCREALYALTQCGQLEADILQGGRFRLRTGPAPARPRPPAHG